jgi:hypothetical protein
MKAQSTQTLFSLNTSLHPGCVDRRNVSTLPLVVTGLLCTSHKSEAVGVSAATTASERTMARFGRGAEERGKKGGVCRTGIGFGA